MMSRNKIVEKQDSLVNEKIIEAQGMGTKKKQLITSILLLIVFIGLFLIIMLPFYAVTLASFKPGKDLIRYGLNLRFDLGMMNSYAAIILPGIANASTIFFFR